MGSGADPGWYKEKQFEPSCVEVSRMGTRGPFQGIILELNIVKSDFMSAGNHGKCKKKNRLSNHWFLFSVTTLKFGKAIVSNNQKSLK